MRFIRVVLGRRKLTMMVVAVGALASLGTALAVSSASPDKRMIDGAAARFSPRLGHIPTIAGSRSDVVGVLAARLPLVTNARVVSELIPVSDEGQTAEAPVLEYDLSVASFAGADITEALWQGNLFAGAVADEFSARGLGSFAEAHGTLVTPDGSRQPVGGGVGHVVTNQVFDAVPSTLPNAVAQTAARFGLRNTNVSTVAGLQPAVVIRATADRPQQSVASLEARGGLSAVVGGPPTRFEGVLLEIRDASGRPIYIKATAPRAGASTYWASPSLGLPDQGQLAFPSGG